MKQVILLLVLVFLMNQCCGQKGFPKQFQTVLNMTDSASGSILIKGPQHLLYDFNNLRARFDILSWRTNQNETYMLQHKPKGAEADSPASQGYTLFNFNPDYPAVTKNHCWYRTDPMADVGPFPSDWFYHSQFRTEMLPWFPLLSNLINNGEQWVPEIQMKATRYDSPEICNLVRSGIGPVPCLSYFETKNRPVKTITAHAAQGSFDTDDYIVTVYLSFTHGIPSEAAELFDLPNQWPVFCGNANNGFNLDPVRGYVVTPNGSDHFQLSLRTPQAHIPSDQVTVHFEIKSNWYYNGTQCARFNPIVFNKTNWQKPQEVEMSFVDYGCCNYRITATGGGYDWLYDSQDFVVYACDGEAGYGCKGKEPCGA